MKVWHLDMWPYTAGNTKCGMCETGHRAKCTEINVKLLASSIVGSLTRKLLCSYVCVIVLLKSLEMSFHAFNVAQNSVLFLQWWNCKNDDGNVQHNTTIVNYLCVDGKRIPPATGKFPVMVGIGATVFALIAMTQLNVPCTDFSL